MTLLVLRWLIGAGVGLKLLPMMTSHPFWCLVDYRAEGVADPSVDSLIATGQGIDVEQACGHVVDRGGDGHGTSPAGLQATLAIVVGGGIHLHKGRDIIMDLNCKATWIYSSSFGPLELCLELELVDCIAGKQLVHIL